eukprot:353221-Chlamydomonas_euryale.AAC.2
MGVLWQVLCNVVAQAVPLNRLQCFRRLAKDPVRCRDVPARHWLTTHLLKLHTPHSSGAANTRACPRGRGPDCGAPLGL